MAAAAACKRVARLGMDSGIIGLTKFSGVWASKSFSSSSSTRQYSLRVRYSDVDTLALVRRLEGQGVPSKQAGAIISAITEVLNDSIKNVSEPLVSKEKQRIEMLQDANLFKVKAEVQSSQTRHVFLLQREIEKMRRELRNEIIKVTHDLRMELVAAKYTTLKYCTGTAISASFVGLAVVYALM